MDIILVRPPSANKGIYINPIGLQELFTFFIMKYNQYGHVVKLVDCWAGETLPPIDNNTILFIDTSDGTQDYLTSQSFRELILNSRLCCLLGEIVIYGDAQALLKAIDVGNIIYAKSWNVQEISRTIEQYIHNSPTNLVTNTNTALARFGFTNAIINAIQKNGDRVYLPGITTGCDNKCTFCRLNFNFESSGLVSDTNFNIEFVLTEIERINSEYRWDIQFTDENFLGKTTKTDAVIKLKRIDDLCELLNQHKSINRIGIDTRCDTVIDPQDMSELAAYRDKMWRKFVAAGLDYVYLGIESVATTQIQRYGKNFSPIHVIEAINYLRNISINFTVGMILFEPMVTEMELRQNIQFIKEHHLQKNMASLFKEMRYYINSPYVRLLKKKKLLNPNGDHDFLKYHSDTVTYREPLIADNINLVRKISGVFRSCGYRHSDMTRLMHGDLIGDSLVDYHSRIINMEIDVIESAIFPGHLTPNERINIASDIVRTKVDGILEDINSSAVLLDDFRIKYYFSVLQNIKISLGENKPRK